MILNASKVKTTVTECIVAICCLINMACLLLYFCTHVVCDDFEPSVFDYLTNTMNLNIACDDSNVLKCNHTSRLFEVAHVSACNKGKLNTGFFAKSKSL